MQYSQSGESTADKVRLSRISTIHYFKLFYRSALLAVAIAIYIYEWLVGNRDLLTRFVSHKGLLAVIWIVFAVEMIARMFPSGFESMGCQKQFARNFRPTRVFLEGTKPILQESRKTIAVLLAWSVLNGALGLLYLRGFFDRTLMLLICLSYSVCDMICILFFCPFQTWFMKNKCCTTCRIYNWDYAMMFTPLMFIPELYTWSLLGLAIAVLILWEIRLRRHPERFAENTNASLSCVNCQEKLCSHKRQLQRFLKTEGFLHKHRRIIE